jgi:histidinol-phosphate/aromatic aminotransferase/cobyric acid decarboxylase-like protein
MLDDGKLEGVAGARLGVGAGHAEQVAKLNEEELLDFPARHAEFLHQATGRRQC